MKITQNIECGSGFQLRQLISRLEDAPTKSLSIGNLQISRQFNSDSYFYTRMAYLMHPVTMCVTTIGADLKYISFFPTH